MSATLKIIGLLLTYPDEKWLAARKDIVAVLDSEGWLAPGTVRKIAQFLDDAAAQDVYDFQEEYVALFDRTPSLCLYLFEHVHGDSRDRGQALVELDMLYRERGLENDSEHTPDYLPLFLEYLSILPPDLARETLGGAIDVAAVLGERLKKRDSAYAALFDAIRDIAGRKPDEKKLQGALRLNAGGLPTAQEMDAAWEQQFAFAMAQQDEKGVGCPKAGEMLKRMETQS